MATEERLEYEFTGNVSSLKKATESAISLLDKYQSKLSNLSSGDVSQRSQKLIQNALKSTTKQVESLQGKLKKVSDIKLFGGSSEAVQLSATLKSLQNQVDAFSSKTKVTAKDARELANAMTTVRQGFTSVVPAIDQAVAKEERFTNRLNTIRAISNIMAQSIKNGLAKVSVAFTPLAAVSSLVAAKFESLKAKASQALDNIKRYAEAAGSGFRQFKGNAESAAGSTNNKMSKLAEVLLRVRTAVTSAAGAHSKLGAVLAVVSSLFGKTTNAANKESEANKKVETTIKALESAINKLVSGCKKLLTAFGNVLKNLLGLKTSADKTTKSFVSLNKVLGTAALLKLGKALWDAADKSMSFIENLNLFTVAMGDSVDEALEFVDTMSEVYGMDPSNLYRYSGFFYQLTDAMGTTDEASKIMSLSLTKAANDIASLFNVDIETVVENLGSGIQGMSMAVRKYGMDIRATTLQQTAYSYGLTENVRTMSEANRQALRYLTMMQQVRNATMQQTKALEDYTEVDIQNIANTYGATFAEVQQAITDAMNGSTEGIRRFGIVANGVMGDFARNIETPANQLRIMKEQISQVARAIGNFLIPVFQKALYVINGVLMAIKEVLMWIASLLGIDISGFGGEISGGADIAADSVGSIGDAAEDSAKKLKKLVAPFDELNILSEDTGTGDSGLAGIGDDILDPRLAAALENMQLGLDEIRMKAMDVRDKILELLGLHWEDGELVVTAGGFIDDLMKLWDKADYTGVGNRIAEFLNQGIQWGVEHTDPAKYSEALNEKVKILAEILNGLTEGLDWSGLGTIIGNGITIALGVLDTFFSTYNFENLGKGLAEGFNGIVDAVDFELLGKYLANRFMAIPYAIAGFLQNVDWITLGTSLATGLMTMLNTVKWGDLASKLTSGINGLLEGLIAFWDNYEWGTLGSNLASFFSTVFRELNWHNLGVAISDTIRGLFREIINFFSQLDWLSLGMGITTALMAIDWWGLLTDVIVGLFGILGAVVRSLIGLVVGIFKGIGDDITAGFKDGIIQGFINIGEWLWSHVVAPVIDSVKAFFGIASPSTVFMEIGGYLIEGLKLGVTNIMSGIVDWIRSTIFDPIMNNIKSFFGIEGDSGSTAFLDIGTQLIAGLFNGLAGVGEKILTWGDGVLTTIKDFFGIHSPSVAFEELGLYMTEGLFNGMSELDQLVIIYQTIIDTMYLTTEEFVLNFTTLITELAETINQLIQAAMAQQSVFTSSVAAMYTTMAAISNARIKSIIDYLDSIPREITTVHTIITRHVSEGGGGGGTPAMASGGVVRAPTMALIGEGRYNEAVIPLGNSPEMQELIDKIADAVSQNGGAASGGSSQPPIEVKVQIGDKEWDAFTYKSAQRGERLVGAQPISEIKR